MSDEFIGQSLGNYEILDIIAKGGMSTVYRARQTTVGRDVAIKILPRQFTHDDTFFERFYREVEVIAGLQHPHILPVYDFGEVEDSPYIVMAYLNGGTLADIMAQGPLDLQEAGRLVEQIASALEFAHSKGIVHRDLKPSNVLLDEQHNAYLADFGLARILEKSSEITGTAILGTPTYMAPEQANGLNLTPSVDVYALGVTIYQMLAGRVPYEAPTPFGVLLAHANEPVPDILGLRPDLNNSTQIVIDKSMAKRAEERYATPSAVAHGLREALHSATQETQVIVQETQTHEPAIIMTNMLQQVIFVDNDCLKLLKIHHTEARNIIGKPITDVLGLDPDIAEELFYQVTETGAVRDVEFDILNAHGNPIRVHCRAIATKDDKGSFVGADITLKPVVPTGGSRSGDSFMTNEVLSSNEETLLQTYFKAHMESLHRQVVRIGGKRLGKNLEQIVNETAERNVWPVHMTNGKITMELNRTDADVYRALMAKAITYAVELIGRKLVVRSMQKVESELPSPVRQLVNALMLDDLINSIL